MKKFLKMYLLFLPLIFLSSCSLWDEVNNILSPSITFEKLPENLNLSSVKGIIFVYINGDNSLSSFVTDDLLEIEEGSKKNPQIAYITYIDQNIYGDTKLALFYNGTPYLINNFGELDSGNYLTLESILLYTKGFANTYQINWNSTPFYLILWDHGDGWIYHPKRAISLDDTSKDLININELVEALKFINKNIHKIDLLGFDACLMGNLETLYFIFKNNITNYIVASEISEPAYGWNYNFIFSNVSNPESVGKDFVDAYSYYYTNTFKTNYSLALYEKNNTLEYISYINQTSLNLINSEPTSFNIAKSVANLTYVDKDYKLFVDTNNFFNKSMKNLNFSFTPPNFPYYFKTNLNISGATISFPNSFADETYLDSLKYFEDYYLNTTINPFSETNYGKFIKDYLNYAESL